MPTLQDSLTSTHAISSKHFKPGDAPQPTAEDIANAKAVINFLMEDPFFLALYRSNDPNVRAAAFDKLDQAHHQAYGEAPARDDETGGRRK